MISELPQRIYDKIEFDFSGGCWLWNACKSIGGYGLASMQGKNVYAHRLLYEYFVGPIPEGLYLDHLCRVRACVNPEHLEPVTLKVNILRGESVFAKKARQTQCVHGHALDDSNTYIWHGMRNCRKCRNKNAAASHRKAREKK